MKRIQMLIPILVILMLTSFTTPVLAAKGKTEKIEYTLLGTISDLNTGKWGTISLTFNGGLKGTPDFEESYIFEGPVDYVGDYDYEYYWFDGILDWKTVGHHWYEITGYESYRSYKAKWYSPQSTFNGKLVAIWNDGSTSTFSVGLSPLIIEKFKDEGSGDIDASFSFVQDLYWWNTETEEWVYDRTETGSDSYSGSSTYGTSSLSIQFSAKLQSKGGPPIQGMLSLADFTYSSDILPGRSLSVSGIIGQYDISCYSWIS